MAATEMSLYNHPKKSFFHRGFSLIELMIVVAIVAILASIAYPSYQNSIIKTRRGNATACLLEMSQFLERYYTANLRYNSADTTVNPHPDPTALGCTSENDIDDFYTFAVANLAQNSYQLSATPVAGSQQSSDSCATLTLNNIGQKGATGANCW
ncbi:hypothetical protein LH51_04240 [Nitrincola sp. A-D6]|uniref:type IV pilin protein n=1 Tax=Nitrincola sp. A-D6 TaxID=1545442 RepID=UPI00051FB9D0|nr:type IV pilin protein [Nitrincola sp. A-D6]KGK42840.1 hypothetical protein LH51_04240 [Nitrincola sp. A-D6]